MKQRDLRNSGSHPRRKAAVCRGAGLAACLLLSLCLPAPAQSRRPAPRLALAEAAIDGASEMKELQASRDSGLLTDWRIVGPFGTHPYADFNRQWGPERDGIGKSSYGGHKVEFFQFADGQVKLPSYMAKDGVLYGLTQLYLRSDGEWRIFLESGGTMAIFVDGKRVLLRDDRHAPQPKSLRSDLQLSRGDHRVMVKFLNAAAPFRLAIMAPTGGLRPHPNIPTVPSADPGYVSAALRYSGAFRQASASAAAFSHSPWPARLSARFLPASGKVFPRKNKPSQSGWVMLRPGLPADAGWRAGRRTIRS